jgi:predicted RNA binding protein YcfA (HicA-like mRNA interferase family)
MHLHEAERLLRRQGWVLSHFGEGSHRHFVNGRGLRLTITAHGNRLPFKAAQLRQDLRRLARTSTPEGERRQGHG